MKKMTALAVLLMVLAGMAAALELTDRVGIGLRADYLTVRRFVSNNFAFDVTGGYSKLTTSGLADSDQTSYGFGCLYANEVYPNTLLEFGAGLQGWSGNDKGTPYTGLSLNPFVGAEHFVSDHFAVDFKVFFAGYSSQIENGTRSTSFTFLNGNLGAHVYF
jgi:hypothetical protein